MNLLKRIKGILNKILGKEQKSLEPAKAEDIILNKPKDNFQDELNKQIALDDEKKKLLDLQIKYRNKEISEEEIPERYKDKLLKLYDEQIEELEKSVELHKKNILKYKKATE